MSNNRKTMCYNKIPYLFLNLINILDPLPQVSTSATESFQSP